MTITGRFTMTRIEILAVSLHAANYADDPNRSSALQLRRLLDSRHANKGGLSKLFGAADNDS
jgi:hypothetical protein